MALGTLAGLTESAWAVTACTCVVANSAAGTIDRVRGRILGTLIGVPLVPACLPIAAHQIKSGACAAAIATVTYR